jgi:aspartate 1-decarboxylase
MLKAKIHNAVVTQALLEYEGSISIDESLLKASGLKEYEKVLVVNKNTGARFETYIIKAKAESGEIGLNGAAARLVLPGDNIIIFAFTLLNEEELKNFKPKIVILNKENKIKKIL